MQANCFKYYKGKHDAVYYGSYPYTAKAGVCKSNIASLPKAVGVTGEKSYYSSDGLKDSYFKYGMEGTADQGLVATAVYSSTPTFWYYSSGVIGKDECPTGTQIDHAVNTAGWGFDE